MSHQPVPSSFRDPSGFLFTREGVLYRQVNRSYQENFEHLVESGLYERLVEESLLVPHQEVEEAPAALEEAFKVLRPERIPFVSYPYEWCFGQLKDAARVTLRIQKHALEHGMSLRDASAYNIQFRDGRPVLIDTLSFERLNEGMPWVGYRQFCQHFLAPLALMAWRDVRLGQLARVYIDGVPLDLTSHLLPTRSRTRSSLLLHVHSHAKSQQRGASNGAGREEVKGRFSQKSLRGLIESLGSGIEKLTWDPEPSQWVDYYEGDSYEGEALEHKRQLVAEYVKSRSPTVVWDLGANTGMYSRIAAEHGAFTVSFDVDPSSVEANYREIVARKETAILPLVLDLTSPSPAIGWANTERMSLAERGPAQLALVLALVHHLAIGNNVPLERVAEYMHGLAETLVIEFVAKSDEKVRLLLSTRADIFPNYSQEGFEKAFESYFRIERRDAIRGSERTLYLMVRL